MIIESLGAENFRKYETLRLENIPEKGLILVRGDNESGKSSVGDALLFALFGQTSSLTGDACKKLVRWGAPAAQVILRIKHLGHSYELMRSVSHTGEQSAKLKGIDKADFDANTPEHVDQQLEALLDMDFETFAQVFYWDQNTLKSDSNASKVHPLINGISDYQQAGQALVDDKNTTHENIARLTQSRETTAEAQQSINLDPKLLPWLDSAKSRVQSTQQSTVGVMNGLFGISETYPDERERYLVLRQHTRDIFWWAMICIAMLLLCFAVFLVFRFAPEFVDSLLQFDAREHYFWRRGFLWGATLFALLSGLLLFWSWWVERKDIDPLQAQFVRHQSIVKEAERQLNQPLQTMLGGELTSHLQRSQLKGLDTVTFQELNQDGYLQSWSKPYEADAEAIQQNTEQLRNGLVIQARDLAEGDGILDQQIGRETARVQHHQALGNEIQTLTRQIDSEEGQLTRIQTAKGLLEKASIHLRREFEAWCKGAVLKNWQS